MAKDEDDGAICRELSATNSGIETKQTCYEVTVYTGDRPGAGTDANVQTFLFFSLNQVFIDIFGTDGSTGKRQLDNPDNNFERNKKDVFKVPAIDVGKLKKIMIEHDDSGTFFFFLKNSKKIRIWKCVVLRQSGDQEHDNQ